MAERHPDPTMAVWLSIVAPKVAGLSSRPALDALVLAADGLVPVVCLGCALDRSEVLGADPVILNRLRLRYGNHSVRCQSAG